MQILLTKGTGEGDAATESPGTGEGESSVDPEAALGDGTSEGASAEPQSTQTRDPSASIAAFAAAEAASSAYWRAVSARLFKIDEEYCTACSARAAA